MGFNSGFKGLTKYGSRNLLFLQKLGPNGLHILTAQEPPALKGITNSIRIFEHQYLLLWLIAFQFSVGHAILTKYCT